MSNAKSSKGNPAHKRMSNPNNAARRARSWKRGEERKERNRKAQESRALANRTMTGPKGFLTPHQALNARNAARVKVQPVAVVHHPVHLIEFEAKKRVWHVGRLVEGEIVVMRRFKEWEHAFAFLNVANAWL